MYKKNAHSGRSQYFRDQLLFFFETITAAAARASAPTPAAAAPVAGFEVVAAAAALEELSALPPIFEGIVSLAADPTYYVISTVPLLRSVYS